MKNVEMYPHTFSTLPAVQVKGELDFLLSSIVNHGVRSYLEVGTGRGDTFHEIVCRCLPVGSRVVAVDLPQSGWGLSDSKRMLDAAIFDLKAKGYDARAIYGSSREKNVIDEVDKLGPFDCVFIDGDHTLSGVSADWNLYGQHAQKITAFHDIADTMRPNRLNEVIEVPIFWQNLKKQGYTTAQVIAENSTMGIGIVMHAHKRFNGA